METIVKNNKKKSKYNNTLGKKIFIAAVLFIPLLNFCVFTIYCNVGGVGLSMMQLDGIKEKFVGFENFERFFRVFKSNDYDDALYTSLMWLPVILLVMFPITLFISFFLYKKVPFSKISIVLLFLPNIIPAAVMVEFFRRMWDVGGGVVPSGLFAKMFSFVEGREVNWLVTTKYANYALWMYTVWFGFGVNSLLIWGAMSRIPVELVESIELDGANQFQEFFNLTVPVIWPTLSIVILIYLLSPLTIYAQPLMLTENGRYNTMTLKLLAINEIKRPDPYYASAINLIIACVSIPLSIFLRKLMDKMFTVVEI